MAIAPDISRAVVGLSRAQHGVLTWEQLLDLGLTPSAIRAMAKRGRLIRLHRGVYAVADPELLPLSRQSAALLSLGPNAVLSHRSAAAVWGIAKRDPDMVDVTVIGRLPRPRVGLRLHGVCRLDPRDIRTRENLRLTSPARTLIDLASQVAAEELEAAFGEARASRLLTDEALRAALARLPPNHAGAATVRRLLRDPGSTYTRSKAERWVRRLMGQAELPQPLVNFKLLGFTADFLWPEPRLVLEVDGYSTHGDRVAFERDRKRDQMHVAAGYTVIRVTWRQLCDEPLAVVARIAQALAFRAA